MSVIGAHNTVRAYVPPLAPSGPPSAHRGADESMASVHAGWLGFHSNLFVPPFHGSPPISPESSCSHLVATPFLLTVKLRPDADYSIRTGLLNGLLTS